MARSVSHRDRLVLSVFAAEHFKIQARELYSRTEAVTGELSSSRFDTTSSEFSNTTYYSKWFSRDNVASLLEQAGCTTIEVSAIGELGHFAVGKVDGS